MARVSLYVLAGVLAASLTVWGQQGGNSEGNTGGGNTGGTPDNRGSQPSGRTDRQSNDPFGQQQQQRFPEQQRPLYLSGQVVMDSGETPPEPVTIERVCDGRTIPETHTDSKGRFSFEVGGNPSLAMTDASVGGGAGFGGGGFPSTGFGGGIGVPAQSGSDMQMGRVDLSGCELRAVLPGYRSDSIQLGRRSIFDNPDVGMIVLHRLGGVEGAAISATSLQAPSKARKAYEKGMKELGKKEPRLDKAVDELEKAVAEYPQYAAAWAMLGQAKLMRNDEEGAREALVKAVEADPKYLKPYPALIKLNLRASRFEETADLCGQVLRLNPHLSELHLYRAAAEYELGNMEEAEQSLQALIDKGEAAQFPQSHQLLGMVLSRKGNFSAAAQHYRTFLSVQPGHRAAPDIQRQLNEWEALGVIEKAQAAAAAQQ